jgi:hypothetical protein
MTQWNRFGTNGTLAFDSSLMGADMRRPYREAIKLH